MHWRRKWQPTPVFLPGESQGRGSLVGCRLWVRTESDRTEVTWQQSCTFWHDFIYLWVLPYWNKAQRCFFKEHWFLSVGMAFLKLKFGHQVCFLLQMSSIFKCMWSFQFLSLPPPRPPPWWELIASHWFLRSFELRLVHLLFCFQNFIAIPYLLLSFSLEFKHLKKIPTVL